MFIYCIHVLFPLLNEQLKKQSQSLENNIWMHFLFTIKLITCLQNDVFIFPILTDMQCLYGSNNGVLRGSSGVEEN